MNRAHWLHTAVACLLLAGNPAQAQADDTTRGAELLAPFKRELMQALSEGLSQGPTVAIEACQLKAPAIATSLSQDGVLVGRASHRLRNPANVAPDWVEPIIEEYLNPGAERSPRTVNLSPERAGYVEPITTAPLCLNCHGQELTAEVAAQIDALYPNDKAVGFKTGDLRGVFWVEYPTTP